MATKEQIKALLNSYFDEDKDRFINIALQLAANAAKKGQGNLANDIKQIVDKGRDKLEKAHQNNVIALNHLKGDLVNLLLVSHPDTLMRNVVFSEDIYIQLRKMIKEQRQRFKLSEYGLHASNKALLIGPPGTGKTLTANILAAELKIPLYTIQFEGLLSKYMGESAAKLKLVFDHIKNHRGVYLFDEFDAIGVKRTADNDVGEIRRILNSFLQLLEQEKSDSIIIAATNHPELLDKALFRRFDLVIKYENPSLNVIETLIRDRLQTFTKLDLNWLEIAKVAEGLNHADIVRICNNIAKEVVLNEDFFLSLDTIKPFFINR